MLYRFCLITLFYLGIIADIHFYGGGIKQELTFQNAAVILLSLLSLFSIFILTNKLFNKFGNALIAFIIAILFYFIKRIGFPLGFNLINNSIDYFKNWAGLVQIYDLIESMFVTADFMTSLIFALSIFLTYRWNQFDSFFKLKKVVFGSALSFVALFILMPYSYDPVGSFAKSVYRLYFPTHNILTQLAQSTQRLKEFSVHSRFKPNEKPNVFLIIVESFNSRFIHQKSPEGLEYTPFFNELAKSNLYFSNYFSNSVYTAKGQFSALCGQVPMLKRTEFKNTECMKIKCGPQYLKEFGYKTFFAQADPNFNTDNTQQFMLNHGISHFLPLVKPCNEESEKCYGLGIKDQSFYRRVFDFVKGADFQKFRDKQPFFMVVSTVSSHMPFTYLAADERKFFKEPKDRKEHYLNFLRFIDDGLRYFITEFNQSEFVKNSIVIITGDHGFPLGEHGSFHNANFAYQENFGVPLLIYEKGIFPNLKKNFSALNKNYFSHLNLSPTILDLVGYEGATGFIRGSIFNEKTSVDNDVYLVQPYSGGLLALIAWPYKYIFSNLKSREWVYNLEVDPNEMNPLVLKENHLNTLRARAAKIIKQQELFNCRDD